MIRFLKSLYLHQHFFLALFTLAIGFLFSYWIPELYPILWILGVFLLVLVIFDGIALYSQPGIYAERILTDKFSNSDENPVAISIENKFPFAIRAEVIDEIPVQFQKRDFLRRVAVPGREITSMEYSLRPVERGEYFFGTLNIFCSTKLGLIKRRFNFQNIQMFKVYPSFIQMKQLQFLAIDSRMSQSGFKRMRKLGHTMEFEQIKEYVPGDDIRTINWKATAKEGGIMVNQFQDEKSQPIYSIVDRSRVMKMPFNNLKLLDYAINSTLAFSNVALRKKDKVGMFSFSNTASNFIPSSSKPTQLKQIQESLYNVDTEFLDADFGILYAHIKRRIPQRSLLMLYTNFEHMNALQRQLPYLLAIARKHLLVLVFFENSTLEELKGSKANTIPEIFDQTIAEQFYFEKRLMVRELQRYGIHTILTKPEDLSVSTINKYLEIKARGLL